jgi:glutamine cyclotransferase
MSTAFQRRDRGRPPGAAAARRAAKTVLTRLIRAGLPRVTPLVVRTLPHDERAYTQGMAYHDGCLYESTGGDTASSLRRIDPRDGRVEALVPVAGDFAEGIAVLGSRLFQISWQSGVARVYSVPDLALVDEILYEGEGWGLARCGRGLVMSDGSSRVRFRDGAFAVTGSLGVRSHGLPVWNLNDLECVGGSLYANVLGAGEVIEVALDSGRLSRVVDCSALVAAAAPRAADHVLNGITHAGDRGTFFLTGKNWKYLFEVTIPRA